MARRRRSSSKPVPHAAAPKNGTRPPRPALRRSKPARRLGANERYQNRELAWLDFNARVLEEALDPTVPLLERVKFLAIFSSNLDEFFMVRLAGLKRQIDAGVEDGGPDGLSPRKTVEELSRRLHELVARQHRCFNTDVAPKLARHGVRILAPDSLDGDQRDFLADYFRRTILPVVTPLAIDPGHPFPHLANKTVCLALGLKRLDDDTLPASELAIVHIPSSVIPRFIRLPAAAGTYAFISLEDAIQAHAAELFAGYDIVSCNAIRVTRDSNLEIDDENAGDLLKTIEEGLRARRMGAAVRLQYDARIPPWILAMLVEALEVSRLDLFPIRGCIAFSDLLQLYAEVDLPQLKDPPLVPARVPALERDASIFDSIARRDALVHHPYQSFDYVVRFLREAAEDPAVLAIKMTLYRVGGASPIVEALRLAAHNGKQVGVLMELKARFEEQANIDWARKLEDAGAHVMYGLPGLKTHAKACLVVRKEAHGIRRYVHLSTGNYNARTAWLYTDFALFSCRDDLCDEVSSLFNLITGYCRPPEFRYLALAPTGLRQKLLDLIRREAAHAKAERPARLVAKMNGLEDPAVIDELYEASQAGVEIDLIVRGICCLRPGVPGLSERIRVTRIVDRFLEHARAIYVANGDEPEYWLASADWMPRNLDRRIEMMFPVLDPALQAEIGQALAVQLHDDVKARAVGQDGENLRKPGPGRTRSQARLVALAARAARGERPEHGL
jgi:polyphosphate kinase